MNAHNNNNLVSVLSLGNLRYIIIQANLLHFIQMNTILIIIIVIIFMNKIKA